MLNEREPINIKGTTEQRVARDPALSQIENRVSSHLKEGDELDKKTSLLEGEFSRCIYFDNEPTFLVIEVTPRWFSDVFDRSLMTMGEEIDFADLGFGRFQGKPKSDSDQQKRRGEGRFHEVKTIEDGSRVGRIGAISYFLNEEGQAISPGFHKVEILPGRSYKVSLGANEAVLTRPTEEEKRELQVKREGFEDLKKKSLRIKEEVRDLQQQEILLILARYYGVPEVAVEKNAPSLNFNFNYEGSRVKLVMENPSTITLETFFPPRSQEEINQARQELEGIRSQPLPELEITEEEKRRHPWQELHYRTHQHSLLLWQRFWAQLADFQRRTGHRYLAVEGSPRLSLPIIMGLAKSPAERVSQWLGQAGPSWPVLLRTISPGKFQYQRDWKSRPEKWVVDKSGELKRAKFFLFNL